MKKFNNATTCSLQILKIKPCLGQLNYTDEEHVDLFINYSFSGHVIDLIHSTEKIEYLENGKFQIY